MSKDIAIEVKNLHKSFRLPIEQARGIKQAVINRFKGVKGYKKQEVLHDISFNVEKGDFFGIVGRNGSGKSTLLKLISNIYQADSGSIKINGSLVSFIELGVGFNPELTGRENVYLNGAMLGFSDKEVDEMYEDIVEFAELGEFMNQKLKNYSSGMKVRLAFSCAIRAKSDILVLDEVLAVGDAAFQRKCNDYFYKLKHDKKTVILVTHSMNAVRSYCNKAVMINEGKIVATGNPDLVAGKYNKMFEQEYIKKIQREENNRKELKKKSGVNIKSLKIEQNNKLAKVITFRKKFSIVVKVHSNKEYKNLNLGIPIVDQAGRIILYLSAKKIPQFNLKKGENTIHFEIENIFNEGKYYLNFAIEEDDTKNLLIQEQAISKFTVVGLDELKYNKLSLTHPNFTIKVK